MLNVETDNEEIVNLDADELNAQFGDSQPKNFKKFEKTNYFNFKNGDNVFRIMPPMFSARETGHFSVYYARHYGYTTAEGKSANFLCLREYDQQTQAMTTDCPFCLDQEQKKKNMENAAADINRLQNQLHEARVAKKDTTQIALQLEAATDEHVRTKALYNSRNARFWVNAMNANGEFGLLPLPKTVYEALVGKKETDKKSGRWTRSQGLISKVKEKDKFDPLAINEGVWFVITRTGSTQYDTEYSVAVKKEEIELPSGDIVEKTQRAPLSEQQKREALTKCKDLNKCFDHLVVSQEQAESIVNGSGEAVSAVMASPQPVEVKTEKKAQPKVDNSALLEKFKQLGKKG